MEKTIGKEEFIKTCVHTGYSSKEEAEVYVSKAYASGTRFFGEEDLIEVFRKHEIAHTTHEQKGFWSLVGGGYTTKQINY